MPNHNASPTNDEPWCAHCPDWIEAIRRHLDPDGAVIEALAEYPTDTPHQIAVRIAHASYRFNHANRKAHLPVSATYLAARWVLYLLEAKRDSQQTQGPENLAPHNTPVRQSSEPCGIQPEPLPSSNSPNTPPTPNQH